MEAAESALSVYGLEKDQSSRASTGSFYTPEDVADQVWDQFFDHHSIRSLDDLTSFIGDYKFVEPSAGSGIFVFTFIRRAMRLGAGLDLLKHIKFDVIDLNLGALRFVRSKLMEIERIVGVELTGFKLVQSDFLDWAEQTTVENVAFVGNPPFVKNAKGSKWRNSFADFVQAMLTYRCERRAICLILPMSVCFSRDYLNLREQILDAKLPLSISSYDNIPDCLFKFGKPDHSNTNKANSQRCSVLNLGGEGSLFRRASKMMRWAASERETVLSRLPEFIAFDGPSTGDQFPRLISEAVISYLDRNQRSPTIGSFVDRSADPAFAVAAVARNFIGIRDVDKLTNSAIPIGSGDADVDLLLLQVLSSSAFYDYWLTFGDGFHVTRSLIDRFPISKEIANECERRVPIARRLWQDRARFKQTKLNRGIEVSSYKFGDHFEHVQFI